MPAARVSNLTIRPGKPAGSPLREKRLRFMARCLAQTPGPHGLVPSVNQFAWLVAAQLKTAPFTNSSRRLGSRTSTKRVTNDNNLNR